MADLTLIIKPDDGEPEAAEVLVDGSIDGHPHRFLLDTGAARSGVRQTDYLAGLPVVSMNDSSGVFASIREALITVPSLTVGPITREQITITRFGDGTGIHRDLIGMDVLKAYRCYFRFDEGRVTVEPEGEAAGESDGSDALQPLLLDTKFHPYVEVWFGAEKASAVWDTGASLTIVDLNFVAEYGEFFAPAGHSIGTDATGAQVETPIFVLTGAAIGGHPFPPHRVAGVDLSFVNQAVEEPMDFILGFSTLRHAHWLFDFPRRQWAITRMLTEPAAGWT